MKTLDSRPSPDARQPLRLRKQTVRTLLEEELDAVVGGFTIVPPGTEGIMCWMMSNPGGSGGSGGGSISFTP